MALEREALSHKIEDDLALRNRNWNQLDSHLAEMHNLEHYFQVNLTSPQLIPDNQATPIAFGSSSNEFYSINDGELTFFQKGVYLVVVSAVFATHNTGIREVTVAGVRDIRYAIPGESHRMVVSSLIRQSSANGTINITVRQTAGVSISLVIGGTQVRVVKLK